MFRDVCGSISKGHQSTMVFLIFIFNNVAFKILFSNSIPRTSSSLFVESFYLSHYFEFLRHAEKKTNIAWASFSSAYTTQKEKKA